jgi:hypothetical protein
VARGGQGRHDAGADSTGTAGDHGHTPNGLGHASATVEVVACAPPKISSATACQAGSLVSISVGLPSHHWNVCFRTVIFQPSLVRRKRFSYQPYCVYWSWPCLFGLRCRETW